MSDITVVILSRGREDILKKTLQFYSNTLLHVLVVHNTNFPLTSTDIPVNSTYIWSNSSYSNRSGIAAKNIHTKYAVLTSDDEILIPKTLYAMSLELDAYPQCGSIAGRVLAIMKYGPQTLGCEIYTSLSNYMNVIPNLNLRLDKHFLLQKSEYKIGILYRMSKSDILIRILRAFSFMDNVSTPYIYEVVGELGMVLGGGLLKSEEFYWIRNWIQDPIVHKNWNRKLHFGAWWTDTSKQSEHQAVIDAVLEIFTEIKSEDQVIQIFNEFVSHRVEIEKNISHRFYQNKFKYLKYLIRKISGFELKNELQQTLFALNLQNDIEVVTAIRSITSQ